MVSSEHLILFVIAKYFAQEASKYLGFLPARAKQHYYFLYQTLTK
jgi:hypothetical protein